MILVGVAQLKGEKLYWGRHHGLWSVSDVPETTEGHLLTVPCSQTTLHGAIKMFLGEMPWADRVVHYVHQIERAYAKGWPKVAKQYEKLLNENYNVYTFARKGVRGRDLDVRDTVTTNANQRGNDRAFPGPSKVSKGVDMGRHK